MPEGDTIHRAANRLRPALAGHELVRFEAHRLTGRRPQLGEQIDDVEARGKHLLVHFSGGLSLRTHMMMSGSWHLYRDGERWRKGAHLARAVVGADSGWVGVCFQAPVVETYHRKAALPDALATLGPDLTRPDPDLATVVARARRVEAGTTLAEVLLDQRVGAGIGNVYKSELCFLHRIDPFTPIEAVSDDVLTAIYETANTLLLANLTTTRRRTYGDGQAVYGKRGQLCPVCGTPVRMVHHGDQARSTYWCPRCQVAPTAVVPPPGS